MSAFYPFRGGGAQSGHCLLFYRFFARGLPLKPKINQTFYDKSQYFSSSRNVQTIQVLQKEFRNFLNSTIYFMLFVMSGEARLVYEPAPTDFADMGLLSSVNSFVYLQVRISHKSFSTFCTTQWLAHPMDLGVVSKQTFFALELDVTIVACS